MEADYSLDISTRLHSSFQRNLQMVASACRRFRKCRNCCTDRPCGIGCRGYASPQLRRGSKSAGGETAAVVDCPSLVGEAAEPNGSEVGPVELCWGPFPHRLAQHAL